MKKDIFHIYIDESCHLEHDLAPVMAIGYVKVLENDSRDITKKIKELKVKHKNPTEIKWNKVSYSRMGFYKELIDLFFSNKIEFRCVLIKNKKKIDNTEFNGGDHDLFYYKTAYYLLRSYTNPDTNIYKVWFDIKDTKGKYRLNKISEVLRNEYKNESSPFTSFQHIRSHENQFIQLADFLIGAIIYRARDDIKCKSKVKNEIIEFLENKTGYSLNEGTSPEEEKFNIFDFQLRTSPKRF